MFTIGIKIAGLFLIAAMLIAALSCDRASGSRGSTNSVDTHSVDAGSNAEAEEITSTAEADHVFEAALIFMPPQSFTGRWGSVDNYLHIWIIYDEEDHKEINFYWHISDRISTRATALIQDNRIVFDTHDDTGHVDNYVYYAVRGTMDFDGTSILLSIERSENPRIRAGESFRYAGNLFLRIDGDDFSIARYLVTQAEYEDAMGINPSEFIGPDLPVGNISWFDAIEYCNRRSQMEGLIPAYTISGDGWDRSVSWNRLANGYRLATEAEWEYVYIQDIITVHNTEDNIVAALEWCWDWYAADPGNTERNPEGPASGSDRVIRGWSWSNQTQQLQSSNRYSLNPSGYGADTSFRLLRP